MEHRSHHTSGNGSGIRKLHGDGNQCGQLHSDQLASSGDSKSTTCSDNLSRWADHVLPGRISGADIKRRELISMEHGSYDAGDYSERFRQLHSNSN